jgi:hypothetical protein
MENMMIDSIEEDQSQEANRRRLNSTRNFVSQPGTDTIPFHIEAQDIAHNREKI